MEVLRGSRAVDDLDIVLRAHREEALDARRRVLGPLSLVAVRQQQDQPRRLLPLVLRRHEELVDHDLGAVHEVAELCLPRDERVLRHDGVAVLEAQRGVLREQGVVHPEPALVGAQVAEGCVVDPGVVADEHGMALRKGSPTGVLPREADVGAPQKDRSEGERLPQRPVDLTLRVELLARLELLRQLRVHGEVRRRLVQRRGHEVERRARDAGLDVR